MAELPTALWIALGAGFGAAAGLYLGDVGIGIALGAGFGVLVAYSVRKSRGSGDGPDD